MLVSCLSVAGGLLATTSASAGSSEWLAANADSAAVAPRTVPAPPISPAPATSTALPGPVVPPRTVPPPTSATRLPQQTLKYSIHLQGGLFAPIDVNATSPTIGLRFARHLGGHVQGGLLTSWTFRRRNLEQPVDGLPGLKPQLVLARIDGQLVPLMGFIQMNLTDTRYLVPYAGVAAGYEWFSVVAHDYRTNQAAHSTYSNWAWEGWGGIGLRLDERTRFDSELFYNGGSLERNVMDSSGQSFKEAIDANGIGARVGLDILF